MSDNARVLLVSSAVCCKLSILERDAGVSLFPSKGEEIPAGRKVLQAAPRVMDPHTGALSWPPQLSPRAILSRYADSGIPTILILGSWTGERVGHAVVVTGTTFSADALAAKLGSRPTAAEFCQYFLVHDDQRGPHLRIPVERGLPLAETPYNVRDHLNGIIIPLPDRVFISAEESERVAWDYLEWYARGWVSFKAQQSSTMGSSADLGDDLVAQLQANTVLARTYLTFGWKYQGRIVANNVPDVMKTASKYPPAKPGALKLWPLKAACGSLTRP